MKQTKKKKYFKKAILAILIPLFVIHTKNISQNISQRCINIGNEGGVVSMLQALIIQQSIFTAEIEENQKSILINKSRTKQIDVGELITAVCNSVELCQSFRSTLDALILENQALNLEQLLEILESQFGSKAVLSKSHKTTASILDLLDTTTKEAELHYLLLSCMEQQGPPLWPDPCPGHACCDLIPDPFKGFDITSRISEPLNDRESV